MDIKGLLADQMGYFTPWDIGGIVLSVLLAALLGFVTSLLAGTENANKRDMAVRAAVIAFAVALVRASIPLSIALVAVALLVADRSTERSRTESLLRIGAAAIGVGCGSSATLVVVAITVPLGLLLRWAMAADKR